MIKYDEDFKILELFIGKIVKEHSKRFNSGAEGFELNKEQMLEKLNGN